MNLRARILFLPSPESTIPLMRSMDVDPAGIRLMTGKSVIQPIYLESVKSQAANILKQEMLSLGGEAAIPWDVSTFKARQSPVLLFGTPKQYIRLVQKLKAQPFGLKGIGVMIQTLLSRITPREISLEAGRFGLLLGKKTRVMGILNVTPDSFSDGGLFRDPARAVSRALEMVEEGAELIDVGGESTRPGSKPISLQEELKRVLPVIEQLAKKLKVPLSIDTTKARVAEKCIDAGASLVNDTSAFQDDPKMKRVVALAKVPVILMHRLGSTRTMQKDPAYKSVVSDIYAFLEQKTSEAQEAGISRDRILVDPGVGFGKTLEHNLTLLKHVSEFRSLGFPIVIGTSRKSFIGKTLGVPVEERVPGSLATLCSAVLSGTHIVRVHDVRQSVQAVRMVEAIRDAE